MEQASCLLTLYLIDLETAVNARFLSFHPVKACTFLTSSRLRPFTCNLFMFIQQALYTALFNRLCLLILPFPPINMPTTCLLLFGFLSQLVVFTQILKFVTKLHLLTSDHPNSCLSRLVVWASCPLTRINNFCADCLCSVKSCGVGILLAYTN